MAAWRGSSTQSCQAVDRALNGAEVPNRFKVDQVIMMVVMLSSIIKFCLRSSALSACRKEGKCSRHVPQKILLTGDHELSA